MRNNHLLLTLTLFALLGGGVGGVHDVAAQNAPITDPDLEVDPSPSTPTAPASPSETAIERAIAAVRAELLSLEEEWATEMGALEAEIAARVEEVTELSTEELALRREFAELGERLYSADEARIEGEQSLARVEGGFESFVGELMRQANDLEDRFRTSLLVTGEPGLLAPIEKIPGRSLIPDDLLERDLENLLSVYESVQESASSVRPFEAEIRMTASGGAIDTASAVRLGLIGGYYSSPLESGFLLAASESGAKPEGRAIGLSESQQESIAALVRNPAQGGAIPMDVTGGAGLAALDVGDSFLEWFEKGGVFMWPIAIVAALALLMVIERAIALALKSRGIDRRVSRVLSLIEAGRTEEALKLSSRTGGPVGTVLEAALVHSDRDRSVMEDAVQEALLHAQPQFTARLSFIALCAAVAPLMGLLGTVTGMILTFNQVTIFGTSDPRFMAGGISVALITTQGGLYLAIPCLLARGVLGAFADSALGKVETGAMSVVLAILESRDPIDEPVDAGDDANESSLLIESKPAEEFAPAASIVDEDTDVESEAGSEEESGDDALEDESPRGDRIFASNDAASRDGGESPEARG